MIINTKYVSIMLNFIDIYIMFLYNKITNVNKEVVHSLISHSLWCYQHRRLFFLFFFPLLYYFESNFKIDL